MLTEKTVEHIFKIKKLYIDFLNRGSTIKTSKNEISNFLQECQKLTDVFKYLSQIEAINIRIKKNEEDAEIVELIKEEYNKLIEEKENIKEKIEKSILISVCTEVISKNIIIEIRPAAGGNESTIFVEDIYKMYSKFISNNNWESKILNFTPGGITGSKEIVFSVSGKFAYSYMKNEFGVHRVQRIPKTESKGRIHTSTVTVSVLPEIKEIDFKLNEDELRFDFFRSSGPGGQSVNTTDSAVRITHIPTGLVVSSQVERSQHKNKEIAMRILKAKLFDLKKNEEINKQTKMRKNQIGRGNRNEKIRTYNFPQNRITDHRFNVTINNLTEVMNGKLNTILDKIIDIDIEKTIEYIYNSVEI